MTGFILNQRSTICPTGRSFRGTLKVAICSLLSVSLSYITNPSSSLRVPHGTNSNSSFQTGVIEFLITFVCLRIKVSLSRPSMRKASVLPMVSILAISRASMTFRATFNQGNGRGWNGTSPSSARWNTTWRRARFLMLGPGLSSIHLSTGWPGMKSVTGNDELPMTSSVPTLSWSYIMIWNVSRLNLIGIWKVSFHFGV